MLIDAEYCIIIDAMKLIILIIIIIIIIIIFFFFNVITFNFIHFI